MLLKAPALDSPIVTQSTVAGVWLIAPESTVDPSSVLGTSPERVSAKTVSESSRRAVPVC